MQKRIPEPHRTSFLDTHSIEVGQYILGLDSLPSKEEFIQEYKEVSRGKNKSRNSKKAYKWLYKYGLL